MKIYHICWFIGKDEHGLDLTTGVTVFAESMLEALAEFIKNNDFEPLYIIER